MGLLDRFGALVDALAGLRTMRAYLPALPSPDGDGYIALNDTTVDLLGGKALPGGARRALEQRGSTLFSVDTVEVA